MKQVDIHPGDCLKVLPELIARGLRPDAIICDLPYGSTQCAWDVVIPFSPMWSLIDHMVNDKIPVLFFGSQPFSSLLNVSRLDWFRHEWIYEKTNAKGYLNPSLRPLTGHENISVFSRDVPNYWPMKWDMPEALRTRRKHMTAKTAGESYGQIKMVRYVDDGERFPVSVIGFSNYIRKGEGSHHPNEKPLDLMRYLVSLYSQPGDLVLDFTMGSGTTGVAAVELDRRFVGIEKDPDYFATAQQRLA